MKSMKSAHDENDAKIRRLEKLPMTQRDGQQQKADMT